MGKTKKILRLIHLANFKSTNIGNGALIDGLECTLEQDLGRKIDWVREAWDDYTFRHVDFDEAFVEKINRSDGLIVGGAVTFNGREYNGRTGTRFELPLSLWPKIVKPVIFYGLSYRHWSGQTYHHIDKLKATLSQILSSKNMILSVRNDGTKDWLKKLTGMDTRQVIEIPDSAVFVRGADDGDYPEIVNGCKNILLSVNDEDREYRFGRLSSDRKTYCSVRNHVIREIVSVIERLADTYPINLILCPHYFDDYRMISSVVETVRPQIAHQCMVSTGLCRTKDTGWFYGRYKRVDFSISMRVHSMSPCIGLGTPMVAFSTQDRITDFMHRVGLGEYCIDALRSSSGDKLFVSIQRGLEQRIEIAGRFKEVRNSLRREASIFHEKVRGLLD